MKPTPHFYLMALIIYLALISIISVSVTCYDKWASKKNPRHRIRENTLIMLSALGGSVAMYAAMQIIRHKTKHIKFTLGIPIIIILQMVAVFYVVKYIYPMF